MSKVVRNIFWLLLILGSSVLAQQWVEMNPEAHRNNQPVLMDTLRFKANFYRLFSNVAGLFEDKNVQELQFGSQLNYREGNYRLPFEAAIVNNQQYAVQITRPLSDKDLFRGYFGYHRRVDSSVKWVHQSRRLDWIPFLLADSSTGRFELNGLYWSGEWAHRFQRRFTTGLGIYYNVDKALKQNFPKPETNHRDIHLKLGLQTRWSAWQFGLQARYFNEQEIVKITRYNLNQELTPVLYKFRFSDLPIILTGKTSEERQIDYQGQSLGFQLERALPPGWKVVAGVTRTVSRGKVRDGGSQPIPQGEFQWTCWQGSLVLEQQASQPATWRIAYFNRYHNFTGDHPEFGFVIVRQKLFFQQLLTSFQYSHSGGIRLFADLGLGQGWLQYQDLMSANYFRYREYNIFLKVGGSEYLTSRHEIKLWSGLNRNFIVDPERSNNRYTDFFEVLFTRRWDYYQNNAGTFIQGVSYVYHYLPLFEFTASVQYRQNYARQTSVVNQNRQDWVLNFWIKFFIF